MKSKLKNKDKLFKKITFFPPRFKSYEDAKLYLKCCESQKRFPKSKWIYPFIVKDGIPTKNPEYKNAHFEISYIPLK